MKEPGVIVVILRQPYRANPVEKRTDPLWEFGSFGCTGCHNANLMKPEKVDRIIGARLAFAQGGKDGFKLVHLTPPVEEVFIHGKIAEAKWSPINMPFKYSRAPLLVNNNCASDFPKIIQFIENAHCPTPVRKFTSKFRARCQPLDATIAEEFVKIFEQKVDAASQDEFASTYDEALPYRPPCIDKNRRGTYLELLRKLSPEGVT